jgi:hypothetical protein
MTNPHKFNLYQPLLTVVCAILGVVSLTGCSKAQEKSPDMHEKIDIYHLISESTGGQVFNVKNSETNKLAQLSDISLDPYYTELLSIGDTLTHGNIKTYKFPVDSRLSKLAISIDLLQSADATVFRPDGTPVGSNDAGAKVLVLSQVASYQIDKPAVGIWKITLNGTGQFVVKVAGSSPLSFSRLNFVKLDGYQDWGFFPIQGYPVVSIKQNVEATISDDTHDVHFEFRARNGALLNSVILDPVTPYPGVQTVFIRLNVDLPIQPFRVYAVGKDVNGKPFQRVFGSMIAPQTVSVKGPGDQNLPLKTDTTYVFQVTNYGAAGNFTFTAVNDKGFVVSLTPPTALIGRRETKMVSVVINPGSASASGTLSTTTFMATPASDPNALGNYAVVKGSVIDKKNIP